MAWLEKIQLETKKEIAILDGQMRLSFITDACRVKKFNDYRIVLVDCDNDTRTQRLQSRGQPELANEDMMNWSKYLRNQANQIGAQTLDNSGQNITESELALLEVIKS